jgi:hypothetical protein
MGGASEDKLVELTEPILEFGMSDLGGWSREQLVLFDRRFADWPWPKEWRKWILHKEYPQSVIDRFLGLRNKHVDNKMGRAKVANAERRRRMKTGEEDRYDRDIELGLARRMVDGVEQIYRVGPAMTRDEIRARRRDRMWRGMVEHGTQHAWNKGPSGESLRPDNDRSTPRRKMQRMIDAASKEGK